MMTEVEAREQLKLLRREKCTCECCERLRVYYHEAGCAYRVAAFTSDTLRPFVGSMYTEELPEAA